VTPETFNTRVLVPGLVLVHEVCGIPVTPEAQCLLLAIAGTETNWDERVQYLASQLGRSYFQFEPNGVHALMDHPVSKPLLLKLCDTLDIPKSPVLVHEAVAWCDPLAVGMARLLLWTDAEALPKLGSWGLAGLYYERNWKPGKPDLARFRDCYATALRIIAPAGHGTGSAVV
jgi:hypothetical protein